MNEPIYLRDIRSVVNAAAERVQRLATGRNTTLIALGGSAGAGRTSLIAATAQRLVDEVTLAAITASVADHEDAEDLAREGLPTVSVDVARPGALDAAMVEQALVALADVSPSLVLIERPGSLAPPSPLGEAAKVVVVSAASAQRLPAHYAAAFAACDAVVVNMMDLVALTDFRITEFERRLRTVNPHADLLPLSCRTGEGIDQWLRYLDSVTAKARQKR